MPMNVAPGKKKRAFQFRLSTAIIVMLMAAGFLYLNAVGTLSDDSFGRRGIMTYGWPLAVWERQANVVDGSIVYLGPIHFTIYAGWPLRLFLDVGLALTLLWATVWLCEPGLQRRRRLAVENAKIERLSRMERIEHIERPLQMHVSTVVALGIVGAVLLLLNMTESSRWTMEWFTNSPDWAGLYGWPLGFNSIAPPDHITFAIDLCVGGALLLTTWWLSESIIRRRAARAPSALKLEP